MVGYLMFMWSLGPIRLSALVRLATLGISFTVLMLETCRCPEVCRSSLSGRPRGPEALIENYLDDRGT